MIGFKVFQANDILRDKKDYRSRTEWVSMVLAFPIDWV